MRKLLILFCCLWGVSAVLAQDGHYTQYDQNPLYLNPALVGAEAGVIRLGGIYRSQWKAVQSPFTNYGVFADTKIKDFGLGLLINQNQAGTTGYKKSNVALAAGYRKPVGEGNNHLAVGLQFGSYQMAIDPTKLTFDNQYNPEIGFDETLLSDENILNAAIKVTDINIGLTYGFELDRDIPARGTIGLALYHVNESAFKSVSGMAMNLDRKIVVHGNIFYELNESFGVEPTLLFAKQGAATEILGGLNLGFNMSDSTGFKIGAGLRLKDAILFKAQFNFRKITLGLGLDYNISKLRQAGNFNNAMEISMIYRIPVKVQKRIRLDTDEDGILDKDDDCPKVWGIKRLNGCPEELAEKEKEKIPMGQDWDKDGILDQNDLCPYEFGYVQFQGCNDQDADGIWDNIDVCPSLPGKVENHGCPIEIPGIDSDRDGVPDRFDNCIYMKGLEEFNGCPDTDGDGISDIMDDCPYVKGKKAWNGCPGDPLDSSINNRGKQEISVDVVEFATDRHNITGDYRLMLDRVADKLKYYDGRYNLVLEGHTDDEGNSSYNFQLSQKRVQQVRKYLIARGVDAASITTYHFGENKPKSANDTSYGKARNRRVELVLFEVE